MKYDDDNNPHGGPSIVISIGMGPPSGKKGKKNGKEADARKAVARGKLKKGLMKMHDSWSPKTAEGKAYDADLKSFIDGLEA